MPSSTPLHLAVALNACGWHPAAWREADARPDELFGARYWTDVVAEAGAGLVDFVTLEDSFSLTPSGRHAPERRVQEVHGRLDAVLVASRVAPRTTGVGLVPTVTVTHTEPFHISKAIATLDYVSTGRAGVRVQVSARPHEAALFGRRPAPAPSDVDPTGPAPAAAAELFEEATDYVEVVRRLWDSWEDDAEIRDAATGRFVDVDRLHYIDFTGRFFSVRGPSITPRPPQGQPLVVALAHRDVAYHLVATSADVGFVTPHDGAGAEALVGEVRAAEALTARPGPPAHVFADLVVVIDATVAAAESRLRRLDAAAGIPELRSDAEIFVGTPAGLADLLVGWSQAGISGFRLRPAAIPHDLTAVTRGLVPELQRRGLFRTRYEEGSLRARLGLPRPANRYAA